jgi:hypothetical protein
MQKLQTVFSQVSLARQAQDQDFERHLIFQGKKETYGDEKDSLDRKLRPFLSTTARDYQPLLRVLDLGEIECGSS